jgi:guanine deaminase
LHRRAALKLGLTAGLAIAAPLHAQGEKLADIQQPATPSREAFMQRAFEMRRIAIERGDQPYGAVIVKDGLIVGEGVSAVITTPDPTAHAEMQAIRDAARRLRTRALSGGEMYGTSRACPMCEAGAYWAGISRLWYGESITDGGAPRLR